MTAVQRNADFLVTVVFRDEKEREDFMKRIHVQRYEKYATAEQVYRLAD